MTTRQKKKTAVKQGHSKFPVILAKYARMVARTIAREMKPVMKNSSALDKRETTVIMLAIVSTADSLEGKCTCL